MLQCQPKETIGQKSPPRKISEANESDYSDDRQRRETEFTVVSPDKDYMISFIKEKAIGNSEQVDRLKQSFMTSAIPVEKVNFKSNDEMRNKYLSKLAVQKVWLPPMCQPKMQQTCIIFDWDDTLLCTSELTPLDNYIVNGEIVLPI